MKYTIEQQLSKDMWFVKFAIDAKDEHDALMKAHGWACYHSFSYSDIRVRPSTEQEVTHMLHNEWIF